QYRQLVYRRAADDNLTGHVRVDGTMIEVNAGGREGVQVHIAIVQVGRDPKLGVVVIGMGGMNGRAEVLPAHSLAGADHSPLGLKAEGHNRDADVLVRANIAAASLRTSDVALVFGWAGAAAAAGRGRVA